jgi:hypothetical protein
MAFLKDSIFKSNSHVTKIEIKTSGNI